MTESSDPQLQLKKRARRRLVGAVAFAGLAAVILPMVMDEEPKPTVQDVQIRIPGQDQPPFKPVEPVAARALPAAPPAGAPLTTEAPSEAAPEAPLLIPPAKPAALTKAAERTGDKAADRKVAQAAEKAAERKLAKPVEKAEERKPVKPAEPVAEKKVAKPAEPVVDKPVDKKLAKPLEKAPEKPLAKKVEKPAEKPAEKPPEKLPPKKIDKPADKPAEKVLDKPAPEKSPEKPGEDAARPAADEPHRATTALSGKSTDAAPTKSGGQHVIVIGAFANPDNVKQLQGKIGGLGVSTYTEVLNSPDGSKTRVRAGPFPSREAAEKALEKLNRGGVSGVVVGRQ